MSRGRELLKGVGVTVPIVVADLVLTAALNVYMERTYGYVFNQTWSPRVCLVPTLLGMAAALLLVLRWWDTHRSRAYGVIVGTVGAPPTIFVLVFAYLTIFDINIYPH